MSRIPKDEEGRPILPPQVSVIKSEGTITQTRSYRLITPLFGGGVIKGRPDQDTPVRSTGIRGQLRFWWRATRGGAFNGDLRAMRNEEEHLWGAASTKNKPRPSKVILVTKITSPGEANRPYEIKKKSAGGRWTASAIEKVAPSYVAFPLQPPEKDVEEYGQNTPVLPVLSGVRFDLTITYPECKQDQIEAALWAWETFGGYGGRTRRGFGAIQLLSVDGNQVRPPPFNSVHSVIRQGLETHLQKGPWPSNVPHLTKDHRFELIWGGNPHDAWASLIKKLQQFRQARDLDNKQAWPEATEIRRLAAGGYQKDRDLSPKFPRSHLGLPIQFHFKDKEDSDLDGARAEGAGEDCKRFASPLILRPIACADNKSAGIALVLEGTSVTALPEGIRLAVDNKSWPISAQITKEEARQIDPLKGNPDVLDAFLNFVTGRLPR